MAGGGARKGAGRKKGSVNRKTREIAEGLMADGDETPLQYMVRVMRDKTADNERRDDMAKSAAPYMHSKLAAIEHTGKDGSALVPEEIDNRQLARAVIAALAKAVPQNA